MSVKILDVLLTTGQYLKADRHILKSPNESRKYIFIEHA